MPQIYYLIYKSKQLNSDLTQIWWIYFKQKAALVWPGVPDPGVHGKSSGIVGLSGGGGANSSLVNTPPVSGANSGRSVSPNSGLVHWVSVMADHAHVPSPAHTGSQHVDSAVHYMWNGSLEVCLPLILICLKKYSISD